MDQLTAPTTPTSTGEASGPPGVATRRGDPLARTGSTRRAIALVAALLAVMLAGGAVTAVLSSGTSGNVTEQQLARHTLRAAGQSDRALPAGLGALMGLRPSHRAVTDFALTNPRGATVRLASLLRHHAVVLTFLDDRCTDVCPLVTRELVAAYRDLGPAASHVELVAVNVDAGHAGPAWLRRFEAGVGRRVSALPTFQYLTGSPAALRHVWSAYAVTVEVAPSGAVYHSDAMYFIAPGGTMRWVATPYANLRPNGTGWLPPATVVRWGAGIAHYAAAALR